MQKSTSILLCTCESSTQNALFGGCYTRKGSLYEVLQHSDTNLTPSVVDNGGKDKAVKCE